MARLVAIEWDTQELRLAAGSRYGQTVSVDTLLSSKLNLEGSTSSPEEVDAAVAAALTKLVQLGGLSRSDVVIASGRANVELRALSLPPATDDEIPEMVRFAAQRSFAQIGDSWPLDYVKLASKEEGGAQVLAATMNPALIAKLKKTAEQATLDTKKVLIRPLASASLAIAAHPSLKTTSALVVSVVGEEADLLVLQNGAVSLIRTSRLPQGDYSVREKAIVAEIKRTWMASESQTPAVSPTQLVLWGDLGAGKDVSQSFSEKTGLPTSILSLRKAADIKAKSLDGDVERFVPVVGMIYQSSFADPNSIDFLSPRKKVEKKKPVLQWSLAAVAAAGLLLYGFYSYYASHAELDRQIAMLKKELKDQEKGVKAAEKLVEDWKKISAFLRSDVNWLDQLVYLSEQSLPADSMVVTGTPTFQINSANGKATIETEVIATEPEMLTELEENLRNDSRLQVEGFKAGISKDPKYQAAGKIKIDIPPMSPEDLAARLEKPDRPIPDLDKKEEAASTSATTVENKEKEGGAL